MNPQDNSWINIGGYYPDEYPYDTDEDTYLDEYEAGYDD